MMDDEESTRSDSESISTRSSDNDEEGSASATNNDSDSEINTISEDFDQRCTISNVMNTIDYENESFQIDVNKATIARNLIANESEIGGLNKSIAFNDQDNLSSFISNGNNSAYITSRRINRSIIMDRRYDSSSTSSSSDAILHSQSTLGQHCDDPDTLKPSNIRHGSSENISTTRNDQDELATSIHLEDHQNANVTQNIHESSHEIEIQHDIRIENPTGSGNVNPIGLDGSIYMSPVRGDLCNDIITDVDFSSNDLTDHMDDLMKLKLGSQILQIIAKHGHGSRKMIHLLACLFHICNSKEEAERMIKSTIAAMSDESEKRDAGKKFGKGISNDSWTAAGMHLKEYGAGVPNLESKVAWHRRKIEESTIQDFVEWLNAGDFLQNLAFGEKTVKISNGFHLAIESIKRTRSVTDIIRKYYSDFMDGSEDTGDDVLDNMNDDILYNENQYSDEEDDEDDEDEHLGRDESFETCKRCDQRCKKSGLRCFLEKNHKSRHKFTPPHLLSPSTINKLLLELTSGEITSRAGLDNTDVLKGYENFQNMRSYIQTIVGFIHQDVSDAVKHLEEEINWVEQFHKVGFREHLGSSSCKCTCIRCGYHDEEQDSIFCENRGKHKPPCQDCQRSFKVIDDMHELYEKAEGDAKERYEQEPSLQDDMEAYREELSIFLDNLILYRAHLVHKHSETAFDEQFYQNLEAVIEVVIICDWKMKILASKFREAQQDWFTKRGSSVLGFEIHLKFDDGTTQVLYHFFMTDDTLQDTEAVLCAKHYLYTKVLPLYKAKKVHFKSDGAGCFSSRFAKASMVLLGEISKQDEGAAYEVSYKVSVAGCGKTCLDGMFGILTMHLVRLVNNGHSFEGAEDLYNLLSEFPLRHSFFHLFQPQRGKLRIPVPSTTSPLPSLYFMSYDRDNGTAVGQYHSNIGSDVKFQVDKIQGLKKLRKNTKGSVQGTCYLNDGETIIDASDHILKSTFDPGAFKDVKPSSRSTIKYQERLMKTARDNRTKHNNKVITDHSVVLRQKEMNGIFCCSSINEHGLRCMCAYATKGGRDRHEQSNEHKYPITDLSSWIHELHLSGNFAFTLATGTRINRSEAINKERTFIVKEASTPPSYCHIDEKWFADGCYNKHSKKKFSASPALKVDLENLFLEGFISDGPKAGQNKYTGLSAQLYLKNLRLPNGRRKYSPIGDNGSLPTKEYIKAWFSRRKRAMAETERERVSGLGNAAEEEEERAQRVVHNDNDELDNECGEGDLFQSRSSTNYDLSVTRLKDVVRRRMNVDKFSEKRFFSCMLMDDDFINGRNRESEDNDTVNRRNREYKGLKVDVLKKLCVDRKLPSDAKKESLVFFLKLSDKAYELKKDLPDLKRVIAQERVEKDIMLKK